MKKLVKALLAVLMVSSLVACSSNGGENSGGSKDAIKVGISGPLTGSAAVYGNTVKNAAELAIEEVNALGGLQYELRFEDDAHDTEKAVSAYGVLNDWGMHLSLGTVTSAPGAAVSPLYDDDHVFALTPSASNLGVVFADVENETSPYGNVFQMCFTDPHLGFESAKYMANHPELGTKVAVIYKNDDNYSTGVYNKFAQEAKNNNLDVVYVGTFDDSSSTDFSVQLTQAKTSGADLVFIPIYYEPASLILTQANSMGYAPTFFGVDGLDGILSLKGFDTSLAEGVYLLTPFSADASDDKTKSFVTKYKEKYGEVPNQFAADVYDCVYALNEACTNGNVNASMSAQEICDVLVSQFTSMKFDGVTGLGITWKETGEVSKSPKAMVIKDGAYVSVQD